MEPQVELRPSISYSVASTHSSDASSYVPPESMGLDRLLATAEQQRLRQMKRIYLMQRHAEKQAALARTQREKEAKDRLREQATEAAAQRARAERQLQEALAEQRRKDAAAKAEDLAEQQRLRLLEKERVAEANRLLMERKRAEEEARRRAEDLKRDAEREEARRRAEADTQLKVRYYELKVEAEDALVAERRQALEAEKAAKTQELKQRAEVARQRVLEQEQRDKEARAQMEAKLMEKLARADIIAEERHSIAEELQRMRKDIAQQEAWVKAELDRMAQTGRVRMSPALANLTPSGSMTARCLEGGRMQLEFDSPVQSPRRRIHSPQPSRQGRAQQAVAVQTQLMSPQAAKYAAGIQRLRTQTAARRELTPQVT
ncbi:g12157 [Coccomyxa viridis]|uniref:G12157 protein n=1 Tax=Coccomyxa viridis TaxID=1274662 RepID=A0ABP1G9M7_9CHLO